MTEDTDDVVVTRQTIGKVANSKKEGEKGEGGGGRGERRLRRGGKELEISSPCRLIRKVGLQLYF